MLALEKSLTLHVDADDGRVTAHGQLRSYTGHLEEPVSFAIAGSIVSVRLDDDGGTFVVVCQTLREARFAVGDDVDVAVKFVDVAVDVPDDDDDVVPRGRRAVIPGVTEPMRHRAPPPLPPTPSSPPSPPSPSPSLSPPPPPPPASSMEFAPPPHTPPPVSATRAGFGQVDDEPTGIVGTLREISVAEIVQMLALSRRTAVVEIVGVGQLAIDGGQLVGATCGSLAGIEALVALCAVRRGTFRIRYGRKAATNLSGSTTSLLLEAARQVDEALAGDVGVEVVDDGADAEAALPRAITRPPFRLTTLMLVAPTLGNDSSVSSQSDTKKRVVESSSDSAEA
jgi:hypothetical protein